MLFFKVDVLELDEALERARIEAAFSSREHHETRKVLLAILDCVVRDDVNAACLVYAEYQQRYDGDTRFSEFLHPVVFEVMSRHIQNENRRALHGLQEPSVQSEMALLRLSYPRIVRYRGQFDLATFNPTDPAAYKHS